MSDARDLHFDDRDSGPGEDGDADEDVIGLERSSIGRNTLQLLSSQIATWTLATLVAVALPRFLGPAPVGDLRLALSLWAVTGAVIGLGTSAYLTLAIARDGSRGLSLVGPILVIRVAAFVLSSLVLAVVVSFSHPSTEFVVIMVFSGLSTLFGTLSDPIGAAYLGLERTAAPAVIGVATRTLGVSATLVVLFLGGGAPVVAATGGVAAFVGFVLMVRAMNRLSRIKLKGWSSQRRVILRASVGFMVTGVLLTVYREIDMVVISTLVDQAALGWYGTADQLIGSSLFVVTIVMSAIFPVLGRLYDTAPSAFVELIRRAFGSLLVAAVPIGLGIVLVAPQLVPLLYGDEFEPTAQVLVVYGFVSPITFGAILFGTVALTTRRQGLWNMVMVVGIVATIPLDVLFVPWADRRFSNGAIGGAMAYFVTETFMFVFGLVVICPFLISRTTFWRSGRVVMAGGLMFAVTWPLRERMLLIPIAVAVLVYSVAIVALRVVTNDERSMVGHALVRLGVRTKWATLEPTGPLGSDDHALGSE